MSSFFTVPASQRKRKTIDSSNRATKRRNVTASSRPGRPSDNKTARKDRDESISGSDSDNVEGESGGEESFASSDAEDETAAEKRLRLAERYLDNLRDEIDPAGFDAADIDKELIAARLREDVADSKGQMYRRIASQLALSEVKKTIFNADQFCPTGVALVPPYAYTVAKDASLCKWELPELTAAPVNSNLTPRTKPRLVKRFTGHKSRSKDSKYLGHTGPILCIAASSSGKFLATGGADRRLVIWDAAKLKPVRVFFQHRDKVLSVAFRRNSHTLYSASADRTIKIFSLDEMTYVETLFGHQDHIYDIAGLAQESCISVGSRDRTARLWRVVEESQLVFRGGGTGKESGNDAATHTEGSMERVAIIDEETFVTGSDNGSISLWSVQRKKPLHTIVLAHGTDPFPLPELISAEVSPPASVEGRPQARWITALTTVPYSDLILSGSWDGHIRAWKVSSDKRRIEAMGPLTIPDAKSKDGLNNSTANGAVNGVHGTEGCTRGIINDICVAEQGDRGRDGICIVAGVSKEHRLGEWKRASQARNEGVFLRVALNSEPLTNGH